MFMRKTFQLKKMSRHGSEEGDIMEEKEREIRIKELIEERKKVDEFLQNLNYHKNKRPKHTIRPDDIPDKDSPFTIAIQTAPHPGLDIPEFDTYDGGEGGDAYRHVSNLETLMRMSGFNDAMLCRILAASLRDTASFWFRNLRSGSIASYTQFKQEFLATFDRFRYNSIQSLSNIEQGPRESVRSYMKRWKDATHEIPQMSSEAAKTLLRIGINRQSDYRRKVILEDPKSLDEMYVIADRCIAMEDALGDGRNCDNRERWRNRRNWRNRN